jgi:hypothetical protein
MVVVEAVRTGQVIDTLWTESQPCLAGGFDMECEKRKWRQEYFQRIYLDLMLSELGKTLGKKRQ